MKLIIECTEQTYSECKKISGLSETASVIANGTPYNPTGDCISREALKKAIEEVEDNYDGYEPNDLGKFMCKVYDLIDNAPTVEPERPQGQWVYRTDIAFHTCSKCNGIGYIRDRFCKHCGAAMQNAERDAE